LPDLQAQIWEKYDSDEVVVIGLDPGGLTGQDANYVVDYAANLGLTFPIVLDTQGTYNNYAGTASIAPFPLDVVVDKKGIVTLLKRDFDIDAITAAVEAARKAP